MNSVQTKLLLDIGNTTLKWATYYDQSFVASGVVPHQKKITAALQAITCAPTIVGDVLVANVMEESSNAEIYDYFCQEWDIAAHIIKPKTQEFGVKNGYAVPERLGVDRWMALIAARKISRQTLLIIDSGTATTFDALTSSGDHLGGLIMPGLGLMHGSLLNETSIPSVEFIHADDDFALDTLEAVSSAAILSTAALAERLYQTLSNRAGCSPQLILTGGNAKVIGAQLGLKCVIRYEPELIMKGLAIVADSGDFH